MSGSGVFTDRYHEVLDNVRRLGGCRGPHRFDAVAATYPNGAPASYRCSSCRGVLGAEQLAWYQLGLAHGRRNDSLDEALNSGDGSYRP